MLSTAGIAKRESSVTDRHVILIHGFWSSPATWDPLIDVLTATPELAGLDFHRLGYESPKVSIPLFPTRIPDYDDVAQSLRPFISSQVPSGNIAFVTHSQGGLILQRYLAWMLNEGRGRELARVRSIVMLACPHEGSEYLRSVRAVLGFRRHPQAGDLKAFNQSVAAARRTVINQIVYAVGATDRECRIPIHVYAGRTDKVVTRVPAQSAFPNAAVIPGDHFSILDPRSPGNITAPTIAFHLIQDLCVGSHRDDSPTDGTTERGQSAGRLGREFESERITASGHDA